MRLLNPGIVYNGYIVKKYTNPQKENTMSKIHVSQVTNQDLVSHFQVSIVDSIYAEDAKGRRKFLTDLRTQYVKEHNKKAASAQRKQQAKIQQRSNVEEFFVELDRAFPEYEVKMRITQPGIDIPEIGLKLHCIVSATDSHTMSMRSTVFSRQDLEDEFGYYKSLKRDETDKTGIALVALSFSEIIEVARKAIDMHKAAL